MKKCLLILLMTFLIISGASCTRNESHTVTINFVPDGGQLSMNVPVESQSTTLQINSNSPQWYPPTPSKPGFIFVNWYLEDTFNTVYDHTVLKNSQQITLYARYIGVEQSEYAVVSFQSYGGTYIPNQIVLKGAMINRPPDPVKEGYTFTHWVYEISESQKSGEVNFSEAIFEHMVVGAEYARK